MCPPFSLHHITLCSKCGLTCRRTSSLDIDNPLTYEFVNDVIRELASLTPGPYIHIGGDEAKSTKLEDYGPFIERIQGIVNQHGKRMIGWQEIAQSRLASGSIVQYWTDDSKMSTLPEGVNIIMSPARRAYLDMKYDQDCQLGLNWAGYINLQDAYSWDPETYLDIIQPGNILGLEAPLWSETLETIADIEFLMFPRLLAYSEIGWSKNAKGDFTEFQHRVAKQNNLLERQQVNYYRSKLVDWS